VDQKVGVGRLLGLLPAEAGGWLTNVTEPAGLLALLSRWPAALRAAGAGPWDDLPLAVFLADGGGALWRVIREHAADAALAVVGGGEADAAGVVLCLGLRDGAAAEPAIGGLAQAACAGGPAASRGRRLVRTVRHLGREIHLLSEQGVEGEDGALAAWMVLSDTLVLGSPGALKRIIDARAAGRTLTANLDFRGQLARTPGAARQLIVLWPRAMVAQFPELALLNPFARDFPVVLKLTKTEAGIRVRCNLSLPALAATWGAAVLARFRAAAAEPAADSASR